MNGKVVNLSAYRKNCNKQKMTKKSEKSYEEVISEEYAEDLTSEFKKLLNDEKTDQKKL